MWNKVFDLSMPLPGNQTRPTTSSQNVETDQHRGEYDFRGRLRDCSWLLLNQEGFGLIQSARTCDTNPWMKRSEAINISLPTANTVHLVAQGRFRRHFQEGEEALPLFHTKRLSPANVEPEEPSKEYPLLIRVAYTTGGKKTKLTTEVDPSNLDEFWKQYTDVMKAGMALKKKDKKRKRK